MKKNYTIFSISCFGGVDFATHIIRDLGNLHLHDYFEISYLLTGMAKHLTLNDTTILAPSSFIIVPPGKVHAFDERDYPSSFHRDILISYDLFKKCCSAFPIDVFQEICNCDEIINVPLNESEQAYLENYLSLFYGQNIENDNVFSSLNTIVIYNIIGLYIKNKYTKKINTPQWFDKLLSLLRDPQILHEGIQSIVKKMGYSHGHLCRLVKQHTNKSLMSLLTQQRMIHAAFLIKTTDTPMIDIAALVGYDSFSHFITNFKYYYNISPFKYKKSMSKI